MIVLPRGICAITSLLDDRPHPGRWEPCPDSMRSNRMYGYECIQEATSAVGWIVVRAARVGLVLASILVALRRKLGVSLSIRDDSVRANAIGAVYTLRVVHVPNGSPTSSVVETGAARVKDDVRSSPTARDQLDGRAFHLPYAINAA